MGLQLPDKAENLEELYRDMVTTGKFDYELCYLLRKQEARRERQDWVKVVLTKRRQGDAEFGKDTDANRFNHLAESAKARVSSGMYWVEPWNTGNTRGDGITGVVD